MIYRKIIIPGQEVRPGVWEAEISKDEKNCEELDVTICQHKHADPDAWGKMEERDCRWECPDCGAHMIAKHGLKGIWTRAIIKEGEI